MRRSRQVRWFGNRLSVGLSVDGPSTPCSRDPRSANQCVAAAVIPGLLHTDFSGRKVAVVETGIEEHDVSVDRDLGLSFCGFKVGDIDLAKVANIILGVNARAVSVEAANPRHDHEWAVWQDIRLPDDKVLLPGVVDTCTNYVEHPELVAQRILRFAEVVGRERVIASSDCGFGTFAGYGKIDPEVAWLKLGSLVDGARQASRQLWS